MKVLSVCAGHCYKFIDQRLQWPREVGAIVVALHHAFTRIWIGPPTADVEKRVRDTTSVDQLRGDQPQPFELILRHVEASAKTKVNHPWYERMAWERLFVSRHLAFALMPPNSLPSRPLGDWRSHHGGDILLDHGEAFRRG